MIVIGLLGLLVVLGLYSALWGVLVFLLALLHNRRRLAFLETDGSIEVFALRLVLIAMPLFPILFVLFSLPLQAPSVNLFGWKPNEHATIKPGMIDDDGVCAMTAAVVALFIGCMLVLCFQRRRQPARA